MESISASTKPPINRSRWRIHLMLITAYIVAVGLMGLERSENRAAALSHTVRGLVSICTLELLAFGLILGLACLASRPTRDDLLLRWRGTLQPVLLGFGYSVALRLAVALVVIACATGLLVAGVMSPESLRGFLSANRPTIEKVIDVAAMRNNRAYFWLTLTFVSFVVAGLREELWRSAFLAGMRTLWPRRFGSRRGEVLAVILCAIIFGLAHVAMGPMAVCLAGLLGVGLGLVMVFHRSIWPAVIAHGCFDATTMAMLPWLMAHSAKIGL